MSIAPTPELALVLSKLDGVKRSGHQWMAKCPAHPDGTASLSLTCDDNGVGMQCMAGCETEDVIASIGLQWTDLFPEVEKDLWERIRDYNYHDENGVTLFRKTRWKKPDGHKSFSISHPLTGGGWQKGYGPNPHVLFNLPAVLKQAAEGGRVVICEGEKDVETVMSLGMVATTNPGGAGKWLSIHSEALRGARVSIIGDNDRPGKIHVQEIVKSLEETGVQIDKVMEPAPGFKDITDMVGRGKGLNDLVPWTPPAYSIEDLMLDIKATEASERDFDGKVGRIIRLVAKLGTDERDSTDILDWRGWLEENPNDDYEWIIENLLEACERLIVVAAEGVGKTTLARQAAIMSACGLHPFDQMKRITPIPTLTIDLENPDKIIRRNSRKMMDLAVNHSGTQNPQAKLIIKPGGMNLLTQKGRDVLENAIADAQPKILFMGPLYKTFLDPGGRTSESIATEVAMFYDYLRSEYKCALWLEQHAPLGDSVGGRELRPFGSAVWSRWPEFGLALKADETEPGTYTVKHFRGARDERDFPERLRRGGRGNFPFVIAR